MGLIIRNMQGHEAPEVEKLGRRAFVGLESLFVSKPRQALVALKDGRIAGAVQYKIFRSGTRKIGYIDFAFVDPALHHQGIGGVLYRESIAFLWAQGCDALTAAVKDDNIGSWGLLVKNGFSRVSLPDMIKMFGFGGMLRHYFGTPFCIGVGMDYYVALRDGACACGKGGSAKQIAAYCGANLLLFLPVLLRGANNWAAALAAYGVLLAGIVLCGYIATRFSKRKWRFRLTNGGMLVYAVVNYFSGAYPVIGNWYPERYENTQDFRRDMGINALAGWVYVLVLSLIPLLGIGQSLFLRYIGQFGALLLLYRVLALYPFEAFGGMRVFRWSRRLYILMAVCSVAVFVASLLMNNSF